MKPAALVLALALVACTQTEARNIQTIWRVLDGDTVEFLDGTRARLAWIDAPEYAQPYGVEAAFTLAALLPPDTKVLVVEHGENRRGERIVTLYKEQTDINFLMVRGGWAWHAVDDARGAQPKDDFDRYADAEAQALRDRLGLWRDDDATAPWAWRDQRACGPAGEPLAIDFGWVVA